MNKKRRVSKDNHINMPGMEAAILEKEEHWFSITEASIKDDFCNYTYEITKGVGLGRTHKVDGKISGNIIDDDMRNAFSKFNVHLAAIDDVFKHSGYEMEDIDKEHTHELAGLFHVTGFKIKGGKENESIILVGNKYVNTAGGRIELESPKIPLDNLSSYTWYNELKAAAETARLEVQLYDGGKYTKAEPEEEEDKTGNLFTGDGNGSDDEGEGKPSPKELMGEFETGKV